MRSTVAREPLDAHREVQQLCDLLVALVGLFEVWIFFDRVFEFDAQCVRNHLRDVIDSGQRYIQRAADVADGGFRFQRSVRSDLRNVLLAVFFFGVVDHHLTAIAAEVDIDIGGFVSTGIQEPLEQQVVLQRTYVAHAQ